MRTGARPREECEPYCPYEQVTSWTLNVWRVWQVCEETWKEEKVTKYGISSERFSQIAMPMFGVKRKDWESAWRWLAVITHALNHPES